MRNFFKRTASFVIALSMLVLNAPRISIARAEGELPVIPKTIFALPSDLDTTWSKSGNGTLENPGGTNQYIYWGRYPQSEITNVTNLTLNEDYVVSNNKNYKIEPIKWRILSTENDKLFLMSDKCLDGNKPFLYNNNQWYLENATWANSDIKKWLNGEVSETAEENVSIEGSYENPGDANGIDINKYSNGFTNLITGKFGALGFLQSAFTSAEQGKIANTTVSVPYATTPDWSIFTWETPFTQVTDKLFLLSGDYTNTENTADVGPNSELLNTDYGFASGVGASPTRQFKVTDFAIANGAYEENGYGFPWARSSGFDSRLGHAGAFLVLPSGGLRRDGVLADEPSLAPALKIPLSSVLFSSAALGAASPSADGGDFSAISGNPGMALRFGGGQGTVTKTGNIVNYASATDGSRLVVVATDTNGSSYQYSEFLENANGSVDLSSKGLTQGFTYQAWVEKEDSGVLTASSPVNGVIIPDTTAPDAPGITSPSDNSLVSTSSLSISGTGEAGCIIKHNVDEGTETEGPTVDGSGNWSFILSSLSEGAHTVKVTQIDAAGNASDASAISFTVDTTAPTGTIEVSDNSWNSFLNAITFGLFFNETKTVKITGSDATGGIQKIEYLNVPEAFENAEAVNSAFDWTEGTLNDGENPTDKYIQFDIEGKQKYIIYARITDKANNYSIINSDGIMIYTNSAINNPAVTFTKDSTNDIDVPVDLNGNTVNKIMNGEMQLTENVDYIVSTTEDTSRITLNASYMNTLTAQITPYELVVHFNPLGESYVEGISTGDAPDSVTIMLTVQDIIEHKITYKNYDGSDVENLPENYPTTYTEGETLTLPTDSPDSAMSGWEFLGFWDCPLDQSKKVTIPGPGYEDEQTLDLTVGNKITEISAQATGDVTLYARYTSDVFDKDVNGRENYIFGAPGVFPNGFTANMRILEAGTQEYKDTLQHVDDKDIPNIKIVEFQVLNSQGEMVQPKTFFGDAVIGFKIPEGFNADDISLIRVVANGEDITLRSKVWTDPDNSDLKYIEGLTNHFSPYAILSPWNESIVATGDNTWAWVTGISAVLLVSAGIFVLMNRKKKSKKV